MNEASSHAESVYRISRTLETEARSLFGKNEDAIHAHLVIDAEHELDQRDDSAQTHNTWIATYSLHRAVSMLVWALNRVNRLELEQAGQEPLFACDPDETAP